jgi:hypothetical protein
MFLSYKYGPWPQWPVTIQARTLNPTPSARPNPSPASPGETGSWPMPPPPCHPKIYRQVKGIEVGGGGEHAAGSHWSYGSHYRGYVRTYVRTYVCMYVLT